MSHWRTIRAPFSPLFKGGKFGGKKVNFVGIILQRREENSLSISFYKVRSCLEFRRNLFSKERHTQKFLFFFLVKISFSFLRGLFWARLGSLFFPVKWEWKIQPRRRRRKVNDRMSANPSSRPSRFHFFPSAAVRKSPLVVFRCPSSISDFLLRAFFSCAFPRHKKIFKFHFHVV